MSMFSFSRKIVLQSLMLIAGAAISMTVGCTGDSLIYGTAAVPESALRNTDVELGIAIVNPVAIVQADSGASTTLQWADIAWIAGTIVRVEAQREAVNAQNQPLPDAFTGPVIQLVGDGTPGTGRDAISDGDSDKFLWNLTGVRVGDYQIRVTIEAPDGTTQMVKSHDVDRAVVGVIRVSTDLPIPTLNFTAPAAADVTFNNGDTFNITWTDNGNSNAAALMTLGLDIDDVHTNGNEIFLFQNEPLSNDGNNGTFTFLGVDENGTTVPNTTYTVFSIIDDNANDLVFDEAVGQLIVNQ